MNIDPQEQQAIEGGDPGAGGRRVDPGAKRNFWIAGGLVGAALVVVCIVAYFGLRTNDKPVTPAASAIALGNPASERRDSSAALSPHMQQELARRQNQEAEEAAKSGRSYIPPDTARIEQVAPAPQAQYGQPHLTAANSSAGIAAGAIVDKSPYEQERRKNLDRFLATFEEASGSSGEPIRSRFGTMPDPRSTTGLAASGGGGAASTAAAAQRASAAPALAAASGTQTGRRIVDGFAVMAARLLLPLTIPENGSTTVLAEVVAGPQMGALVTGTARVVNEGIEIRFTQARFGRDMYTVQAIGLDGETSNQLLSGSVDRKVFQRYVIPIALATAQGFFQAKAAVGSTVVGLNVGGGSGSVAGVQTPAPSNQQAVAAGVAAGMTVAATDANRIASTPIVVSVPAQTPIGVLFLNEVLDRGAAQ